MNYAIFICIFGCAGVVYIVETLTCVILVVIFELESRDCLATLFANNFQHLHWYFQTNIKRAEKKTNVFVFNFMFNTIECKR